MNEAFQALAAQLEAILTEHERDRHHGDMCRAERVNAMAFLAHRLGIRGRDLLAVMERAEEYRRIHDEKGN